MSGLVLSCFSGVGSLDEGFRRAGFCVVSAGDVAWGSLYDIRNFHPPRGVFDGVIGGDPCQSHSALANLVRAKGLEPSFPDLGPELARVIEEARPCWFLRENVPRAPDLKPEGYDVASFLLDHSTMDSGDGSGHEQARRRRFWFGVDRNPYNSRWDRCRCCDEFWCHLHRRHASDCSCFPVDEPLPELRAHLRFALTVLPDPALTVDTAHNRIDGEKKIRARRRSLCGDARSTFIPGGQAEVDALRRGEITKVRRQAVTGRHTSNGMGGDPETTPGNHPGRTERYTLEEMLDLQGLPADLFDHSPLRAEGKRKFVGNAVALPMAEALARAIRLASPG